jgi:hypothetical protein
LVLRVSLAEAANPTHVGQALLKGREPTILAAKPVSVNRAPRIVLGHGAISNADDANANSQDE